MRRSFRLLPILLLWLAMPAEAVSRVELSIAHIEAPAWHARDVHVDWRVPQAAGALDIRAKVRSPSASAETSARLRCEQLDIVDGIDCTDARLQAENAALGRAELRFAARLLSAESWTLRLDSAQARVNYNASDGRVAAEALALTASARIQRSEAGYTFRAHLQSPSGQAYVEPVFLDFTAAPLAADLEAHWPAGAKALQVRKLEVTHQGLATLQASGELDLAQPARGHRLQARVQLTSLEAGVATYLSPLLAGTRLQDLAADGRGLFTIALENGAVPSVDIALRDARLDSTQLGLTLEGLDGELHWRDRGDSPVSRLRWQSGRVVALPIGPSGLEARISGRDLRLLQAARIPVLDGALRIQTLVLGGLGTDNPAATFDASLEPIDLALLGRSLGWPEFGGRLSGRLPGLRLKDRELSLDGALTAQAFDGEITVDQVRIDDPFGVLPRVRADLRLRRLDLDAITRAFSFGRITGRLDGEFEALRLLGWEPVAMRARLYSTPGDSARRRISQRAIDNISAIGGGPTGVLSRGVMRLFDDFAYARMGWSCVLANGVCRMDGIAPARARADGQPGYVLVQGRLLPRIDVIGFTREVNWNTFVRQLAAVRNAEGVELR